MTRQSYKLLEREAPLRALAEARERAQEGGCIALVSGEAGIGKTSLVTAFTDSIAGHVFVAFGRCDALFTPRVLGPAHDIAARQGGMLPKLLESGAPRPAIFAAFLEMLRAPSNPVIVFEDVHWADEATLDLVKYLGRRIGETRALLLLTHRDDELQPRHPLRLVLGELPRNRVASIHLEPLSPAAVEDLARAVHTDARGVHQATGGNPFYVTEILAAGGRVSDSVRDVVLARAARLAPGAREAADLASVAPGGLETEIIEALVPEADQAIAECEVLGVMRVAGGVARFRHEIARLAIEEALGGGRRRMLNARVLEALRAKARPELARLAHHAEAAEDAADAFTYSKAAAERATTLGAHREAAEHYSRALRYSGHLSDVDKAELLEAAAWELQLTVRTSEAVAAREEALEIWHRTGDRGREATCLGRHAHLLIVLGRNPEGERAIQAALRSLDAIIDEATQALVHRHISYIRMLERDARESVEHGEKALALAEKVGDVETQIHALNTLGSVRLLSDDERGYPHLERSLELARQHGLDYHVGNAYGNLGSASGEVYRVARAMDALNAGIDYCAHHDLDTTLHYQLSWRALIHLFMGNWGAAAEDARAVLDQPNASAISRIMALLAVGRLRARRGDPGVWDALDEALSLSEGTRTLQRLAPVRSARAEAAWLDGEDAAAAREAGAAEELARRKEHAWFAGELLYWQWKGGKPVDVPRYAAAPFALQISGRWREAAEAWRTRGCPYEAARALAEGDTAAKLEALRHFDALGALPAAQRVRQSLRAAGVRRIPRGPRPSTKVQPAGLTTRQAQILGLVSEGLTNAEVGARLHISAKTVEHHVSAILAKLGVATRREAIRKSVISG